MALVLCSAACVAQTLTISSRSDSRAFGPIGKRVVTEAFRRAGIGLIFRPLPMLRAIEDANDGESDGDMNRIADVVAEYPNLLAVPTPVSRLTIAVYGNSPAIRTMTRAEISRMKIGYQRGFLLVRKYTKSMDTRESGLGAETFDMLANGRVDVVMTEYIDAESLFAQQHLAHKPPMWPYAWVTEPMYLMLNKRYAALVPRLDAALQQMNREGLIDRIYDETTRDLGIAPLLPDTVKGGQER